MGKSTTAKDIRRAVKNVTLDFLSKIYSKISPTYRNVKRLEKDIARLTLLVRHMDQSDVNSGERKVQADIESMPKDHLNRYKFTATMIKSGNRVLDIACGTGYGTCLMSKENPKADFIGVDISKGAIEFAEKHYKQKNNELVASDATTYTPDTLFDVIVSFETIEHLEYDEVFIEKITQYLKPGGLFICSTPNQLLIPHSISSNPFHYRHYTPKQMSRLLKKRGGLIVKDVYAQRPVNDSQLTPGILGHFTVHIAHKPA